MMVSVCTAMLLGASLTVAMTSEGLGYNQAYSQAALQLADAGVNSELQYVAPNVSIATVTLKSSQPQVSLGVTVFAAWDELARFGEARNSPRI
jgi:hypothetical protein